MPKLQRFICIHGHFYQPPRENPWLEEIEVQDSAAPYHDWNERITAECYGPNSRARILNANGGIEQIVNNYARMSFNFGPTLLSWMEQHAPEVLEAIVEGDRLSQKLCGGHGNAIAQVYNHAILPLCTPAEKRIQVRWGLADFRLRFDRESEGLWLAETAVDIETLETLAAEGIRFTILAPRQARRWRAIGASSWQEGPIHPTHPYLCRLPSGRSIDLFFYHGGIAQAVAFEKLLNSGDRLVEALLGGFRASEDAQLVHIATDGETYGHHHRYGEMALAYALEKLDALPDVQLTNYGQFLEEHPPRHEVEIAERTSWSCVHGVERWRSDCGCGNGGGAWHQKWRAPLRTGLTELKRELDSIFARKGKSLFVDPAVALDAYVEVLLRRGEESIHAFLARHCRRSVLQQEENAVRALKLLEMQRHGLLMFTSCGWFFDEITGLEATQVLLYAARAIQLVRQVQASGPDLEARLLDHLAEAPSNLAQHADGAAYWSKAIAPAAVDLSRVHAHVAITSLFPEASPRRNGRIYCYQIEALSEQTDALGRSRLAAGSIALRSDVTLERSRATFAALYLDRLDMHCFLGPELDPAKERELHTRLFDCYRYSSLLDLHQMLKTEFPGPAHRLGDLFIEDQRRIVRALTEDRFEDYAATLERLAAVDDWLVQDLGRLHYPIPRTLVAAVSLRVDRQLDALLEGLQEPSDLERIANLLQRSRVFGYRPDPWKLLERRITELLERRIARLEEDGLPEAALRAASLLLDAAALLKIEPSLWHAQNRLLRACRTLSSRVQQDPLLRSLLEGFAPRLGLSKETLAWNA
jgi:alpha-amylase/alpha-mannosidase (GH57 family)